MIISMDHKGFTIVELIVIVTVMGVLLVLGTVNLTGSQANARDSERKTDVETIAAHLESYYRSGDDTSTSNGRYPSTTLVTNVETMKRRMRDIDVRSITAPGITSPIDTFKASTNSGIITQTTASVIPQPTKDQYIYQPIQSDGTLCTLESQECRKFNIYYKLETATVECPGPNNICMITSKNQ